jgi:hypothetical protein
MVFYFMNRLLPLLSDIGYNRRPVMTAAVFAVGPLGWLLVMLLGGRLYC